MNSDINTFFPNYKEDKYYGGTKQLLHIEIEDFNIIVKYIYDGELIQIIINYHYEILKKYYNNIIKNNIIENNCIYDINDNNFIKQLDKYKRKININTSDEIEQLLILYDTINFDSYSKIKQYLLTNTILNNKIYCDSIELTNLDIYINFIIPENIIDKTIKAIKILDKYYDYKYLRKYIPYCIELNIDTNDFYIMNRDYEYIELNTKDNSLLYDKKYNLQRIYLFNDGCSPYNDNNKNENLKKILIKYNEFNLNYKCLNMNIHTKYILNLL